METITLTPGDAERFWAKVDTSGDCWGWQAATLHGYGRFTLYVDGKKRVMAAHRISYMLIIGPIAPGNVLDHICRNPSCVNPDHLRSVTVKQNAEHRAGPNANSTSGVHGVYWRKDRSRWVVRVRHNGRMEYGGYYATMQEAEAAAVILRNNLYTHNDADKAVA